MRKLIKNYPDKAIYDYEDNAYEIIYFKDFSIMNNVEVAGRGAIVNRFSAELFKKLSLLQINTNFTKIVNMRECVVKKTIDLPFKTRVFIKKYYDIDNKYNMNDVSLDMPLIEHISENGQILSEKHLLGFNILDIDEIEELEAFILEIICILKGIFINMSMEILCIEMNIGRELNEDRSFILLNELSPENICVNDIDSDEKLGMHFMKNQSDHAMHYKKMALKMGIYLGGISRVIPLHNNIKHNSKFSMHVVE